MIFNWSIGDMCGSVFLDERFEEYIRYGLHFFTSLISVANNITERYSVTGLSMA